jgi:TfoX/Sxy family transcriptional regulator of competence genes
MAFNEILAERIRQRLARRKGIEEKNMFGGIGFLLNGNMLVGVWKDSLIVRLGPDDGVRTLAKQTAAVNLPKERGNMVYLRCQRQAVK